MPVRIILAVVVAASAALAGDFDVKSLDKNHDGKIDQAELQPFLQAMNHYNGDAEGVLDASGGGMILRPGTTPAEFRLMPAPGSHGPSPITEAADHIRGILREFLGYLMKKDQPDQMQQLAMQMVKAELKFAEAEIQYNAGKQEQAIETLWSIVPADQRDGAGEKAPAHHEAPTAAMAPPKHEENSELAQLDAERGKIEHRIHELIDSALKVQGVLLSKDTTEDRRAEMNAQAAALMKEFEELQAQSAKIADRMAAKAPPKHEEHSELAQLDAEWGKIEHRIHELFGSVEEVQGVLLSKDTTEERRAEMKAKGAALVAELEQLKAQCAKIDEREAALKGGKAEQPNPGERLEAALKEVRQNISKTEQELAGAKKKASSDELNDGQRAQIEKAMADMQRRLEELRKQRGYLEGKQKELRGGK